MRPSLPQILNHRKKPSARRVPKNVMTVGAVGDAVSGGVRSLAGATMSSFSGWGPCDDGRIKPDIVANGVSLYSPLDSSATAYGSLSGTSMASPNAAGSAILLVDYYESLFPAAAMRASTLKGLIIHTADDLGRPGPDYCNGWGLVNTKAAADQILAHHDHPACKRITEGVLDTTNTSGSCQFIWDDSSPIRATLSWTDPAATGLTGLDDSSPRLINDLDLRIEGPTGTTYYPFTLDRTNPGNNASTGDNTVDNVEQVTIASPGVAGIYTATVTHKNTLTNGLQYYSLIISGQSTTAAPVRLSGFEVH